MNPEYMEAVRGRMDKAIDLVCDLASGDEKWRMSVPANEDKDSDLILVNVLGEAKALLNEIQHLERENAALRRGQGTAPAPATPGTTPFHTTHPIPDSTTKEN